MVERCTLPLFLLLLPACGEGPAPARSSSPTPAAPVIVASDRIASVCGLVRARETAYRTSLDPGPSVDPEPDEVRGSLWGDEDKRGVPSVLEGIDRQVAILEGRARDAPVRDRCEADLGRYALVSPSGFACIEGCAGKEGYRRLQVCTERCIKSDSGLLAARRAARRSVQERAGVRAALLEGARSKTARARIGTFSLEMPEGARAEPGGFVIEKPEWPRVLSVSLRSIESPRGSLAAEGTWGEKGTGLVMLREAIRPTTYLLARIGSTWELSARPLEPETRDELHVQIVREAEGGAPRFECIVHASLLDMDDLVTEAAVAWAERICASVVYEGA